MSEEPFALAPFVQSAPPSEQEFEAICGAVTETARGRWFLSEYARRNRSADTRLVLTAIARLETALAGDRAATPSDRVPIELADIADALAAIREEVAAGMPGGLDAIAQRQKSAAATIRAAAGAIAGAASFLRESNLPPELCDDLDAQAAAIREACEAHDLSAHGAQKLVQVLRYTEGRIHTLIEALADSRPAAAGARAEPPPEFAAVEPTPMHNAGDETTAFGDPEAGPLVSESRAPEASAEAESVAPIGVEPLLPASLAEPEPEPEPVPEPEPEAPSLLPPIFVLDGEPAPPVRTAALAAPEPVVAPSAPAAGRTDSPPAAKRVPTTMLEVVAASLARHAQAATANPASATAGMAVAEPKPVTGRPQQAFEETFDRVSAPPVPADLAPIPAPFVAAQAPSPNEPPPAVASEPSMWAQALPGRGGEPGDFLFEAAPAPLPGVQQLGTPARTNGAGNGAQPEADLADFLFEPETPRAAQVFFPDHAGPAAPAAPHPLNGGHARGNGAPPPAVPRAAVPAEARQRPLNAAAQPGPRNDPRDPRDPLAPVMALTPEERIALFS